MDGEDNQLEDPFADEDRDLMDQLDDDQLDSAPRNEEEDDDESELVVLDPDHPLMARFQIALKNMLTKQLERVDIENKEFEEARKKKSVSHLELGNELYNVQQELAKQQMNLEKLHDNYSNIRQTRVQTESQLDEVRNMYKTSQITLKNDVKKTAELRSEVDNLSLRLFYMKNAQEDVRGDIAVMRRAAEKVESDVTKAESEKMQQDLMVDRLVEQTDRLREEIALYDAQMTAQSDEREAVKTTLREAQMEIESIKMERKQLLSQWNSSLIGLQRRNEAHAVMSETLHEKQERILSLNTECEGYKKSISVAQEQNEKLTILLNKTENDIATVRKMLALSQSKYDTLKGEYSLYTRMLHETESALFKANGDKTARAQEIEALRKQIEKENLMRVNLEDQITQEIRTRLTLKKAAEYTNRLTGKLKDRTRDMESDWAIVENERATSELEKAELEIKLEEMKKIVTELDKEIANKNENISKLEQEISRNVIAVERKQGAIDLLNKRLETMIASSGGVELGPLEVIIVSLNKSINAKSEEIAYLEQQWLREQQELVRMSNEKFELSSAVNLFRKQLTIISQKKIRIEGEIDSQKKEKCDAERNLRHLQNDMVKLNGHIFNEKDQEERLEKHNNLVEVDFVRALKEQELESMEMKEKVRALIDEKESLLNNLVEAERQIMLWEKRIQLGQETQSAVDSEVGQGEIAAMRSEIHRMQVRYSQLMRQQEKLVIDMEKAVSRRDTIVTRSEAQQKMKQKVVTKGTVQKQMAEIRKKIKQTIEAANDCDSEIGMLRAQQGDLTSRITDSQNECEQLQLQLDEYNERVQALSEQKNAFILELAQKQLVSRYYQQLNKSEYSRFFKTMEALASEESKQTERTQSLHLIVDRICQEFPQIMRDVNPIRSIVQNRLGALETEISSTDRT